MRKFFSGIAAIAMAVGLFGAGPAHATTAPNWNLAGTCTMQINYLGTDYAHQVTFTQDSSGNLDGTGTSGAYAYDITSGSVSGNTFMYSANYTATSDAVTPQTVMMVNGNVASNGNLSGTWSDNYQGGSRSGTFTSNCTATAIDHTAPAVPMAVSPANGTTLTTAQLTKVDWTTVTDSSSPVTYFYEVSNSPSTNANGSFVTTAYQSGALSDSEIATPNTPAGTYYWHVRAVDSAGNSSAWSTTSSFIINNTPTPTTPTYTFTGEGRTGTSGKPAYTFEIDEDGMLTVVNHQVKPPCVYHIDTDNMTYNTTSTGNTASFTGATGKAGNKPCPAINVMFTDNTNGSDSVKIGTTSYPVTGGSFMITSSNPASTTTTFTAANSSYYNGPTSSAPLYGTGPISFTYNTSTGAVTGGTYTETVSGTTYYNMITGGTVSGNNVTLTFSRTNPNNYSFNFVGTMSGNTLSGNMDGPYYFTATGTTSNP